jgi:predicted Rdx family selenoprotein
MIEGSGGVFEVTRDGKLIFSKKATGRRPTWSDIRPGLEP